jgi:hypothetical protein
MTSSAEFHPKLARRTHMRRPIILATALALWSFFSAQPRVDD